MLSGFYRVKAKCMAYQDFPSQGITFLFCLPPCVLFLQVWLRSILSRDFSQLQQVQLPLPGPPFPWPFLSESSYYSLPWMLLLTFLGSVRLTSSTLCVNCLHVYRTFHKTLSPLKAGIIMTFIHRENKSLRSEIY